MDPKLESVALDLGVGRSIISAEQAEALRAISRVDDGAPAGALPLSVDDEAFRFITGFADIFVTIGIALFLGAFGYILALASGPAMAGFGVAAGAWLLAEFFTRRRRMALPSIALLVVFVVSGFAAWLIVFDGMMPLEGTHPLLGLRWLPASGGLSIILAGLLSVALTGLYYYRFRVPITVAAGLMALFLTILGLCSSLMPALTQRYFDGIVLASGLCAFALAMRFDLSDPQRRTRRSDIAFWLHLLAAPLIVHSSLPGLVMGLDRPSMAGSIGALLIFVLLGLVAVVIDRRAIMVSGLLYAGIALGRVIEAFVLHGASMVIPVVVLSLGAFILLLSAGWRPLRRALMRRLPLSLSHRLPQPELSPVA